MMEGPYPLVAPRPIAVPVAHRHAAPHPPDQPMQVQAIRAVGLLFQLTGLAVAGAALFSIPLMDPWDPRRPAVAWGVLGLMFLITGTGLYYLRGWARTGGIALALLCCLFGKLYLIVPALVILLVLRGEEAADVCTDRYRQLHADGFRWERKMRHQTIRRLFYLTAALVAGFLLVVIALVLWGG